MLDYCFAGNVKTHSEGNSDSSRRIKLRKNNFVVSSESFSGKTRKKGSY